MANTKLDSFQKEERKNLLEHALIENVKVAHNASNTVMAYREKGNTVQVAFSVASPDEQKFRRKVGEFFALDRFFMDRYVIMDRGIFRRLYHNEYFGTNDEHKPY